MIDLIYRARYQALTILSNRGYNIPNSLFNISKYNLNLLYQDYLNGNESILNIIIKNKECLAKIAWIDKITPGEIDSVDEQFRNDIKNYQSELSIENGNINKNDNLIIITIHNKKLIDLDYFIKQDEGGFINIENEYTTLFSVHQLQFNLIDHILVPKHIVLDTKELINLKKKLNYKPGIFPKIIRYATIESGENKSLGDPVARYYGLKTGDIVKIIRNIPELPKGGIQNTQSILYREVVDISNNKSKIYDIKFPRNKVKGNVEPKINIGKTYFFDKKKSGSYSDYTILEIISAIKYGILNNNKDLLDKSIGEFVSFYFLYFHINRIIGNFSKTREFYIYNKKILSRFLKKKDNYSKNDIISKLDYFKATLKYLCFQKTKDLLYEYYLSPILINSIDIQLTMINNVINRLDEPDILYKELKSLYYLFLSSNISKSNILIDIYTINKNINVESYKPKDEIVTKNYHTHLISLGYDLSFLDKVTNKDVFLNILNIIIEKKTSKENLEDLIYYYHKLIDTKNSKYVWDLLKIVPDKLGDSSFKSSIINSLGILEKWYTKNNSNACLLNGLVIILYRDEDYIQNMTLDKTEYSDNFQLINTHLPNYVLGLSLEYYRQLSQEYEDILSDLEKLDKETFYHKWLKFLKKNNPDLLLVIDNPDYKEIVKSKLDENINNLKK